MKNKMEVVSNIYVAGVYAIKTKDTDKVLYVGSSIEVNDAMSRHIYYLKRGLYAENNKAELQRQYDLSNLKFEVIKESVHSHEVKNMSAKEKENLYSALSALEKMYIDLYKDTVINKQMTVKQGSSNKNTMTTYKRRKANLGSNNPRCKYNEELISNIIWLKENTQMKNREIKELIEKELNVEMSTNYIYCISVTKWLHVIGKKPTWYMEVA